jgi:hypothetical protein
MFADVVGRGQVGCRAPSAGARAEQERQWTAGAGAGGGGEFRLDGYPAALLELLRRDGYLEGMGTLLRPATRATGRGALFPARIFFIYVLISFSREIFCHISGAPHARDLQDPASTVPEFNHSTGANRYE